MGNAVCTASDDGRTGFVVDNMGNTTYFGNPKCEGQTCGKTNPLDFRYYKMTFSGNGLQAIYDFAYTDDKCTILFVNTTTPMATTTQAATTEEATTTTTQATAITSQATTTTTTVAPSGTIITTRVPTSSGAPTTSSSPVIQPVRATTASRDQTETTNIYSDTAVTSNTTVAPSFYGMTYNQKIILYAVLGMILLVVFFLLFKRMFMKSSGPVAVTAAAVAPASSVATPMVQVDATTTA